MISLLSIIIYNTIIIDSSDDSSVSCKMLKIIVVGLVFHENSININMEKDTTITENKRKEENL